MHPVKTLKIAKPFIIAAKFIEILFPNQPAQE